MWILLHAYKANTDWTYLQMHVCTQYIHRFFSSCVSFFVPRCVLYICLHSLNLHPQYMYIYIYICIQPMHLPFCMRRQSCEPKIKRKKKQSNRQQLQKSNPICEHIHSNKPNHPRGMHEDKYKLAMPEQTCCMAYVHVSTYIPAGGTWVASTNFKHASPDCNS